MGANRRFWVLAILILWVSEAGSITTKDDEHNVTVCGEKVFRQYNGCMDYETGVWFSMKCFCPWKVQVEREEKMRRS